MFSRSPDANADHIFHLSPAKGVNCHMYHMYLECCVDVQSIRIWRLGVQQVSHNYLDDTYFSVDVTEGKGVHVFLSREAKKQKRKDHLQEGKRTIEGSSCCQLARCLACLRGELPSPVSNNGDTGLQCTSKLCKTSTTFYFPL